MATKEELENVLFCYAYPILNIVTLVPITICLIVLMNRDFKENMYKYFFLEEVFVAIDLIIGVLKPLFHCQNNEVTKGKHYSVLVFIYLINFLSSVVEEASLLLNIFAVVEFLFLVSTKTALKRFNVFQKVHYLIIGNLTRLTF